MRLGIGEIYEAARAAGFTPDQATTWTAIALAESGGETGALNDSGEHSQGLWQINVSPTVRPNVWGDLTDPRVNARAAYDISHHGTDMRPWTTTHASHAGGSGDYRAYLDDVSAVTGYAGDPRGVGGYSSPLPDPLPPSGPPDGIGASGGTLSASYDLIDPGHDPAANLDTDHDGLTDAYERLVGSSPDVADTDQDGLSDAYEHAVSGTDPLLADTDSDTLSDSAEVSLGTDGTLADTDQDGIADGTEVQLGGDPLHAEHGVLAPTAPVGPASTVAFTAPTSSVASTTSTTSTTGRRPRRAPGPTPSSRRPSPSAATGTSSEPRPPWTTPIPTRSTARS